MNLFIGNPDAVPDELCAFFATAYAEVDGARIDPGLKPDEALAIQQKMRDDVDTAVALRTIAPLFLRAVAADKAGSTELGIPQLAEMIQKVANTKADLPDAKFHKDVQTAINAWRDEHKRFARQVREKGSPISNPATRHLAIFETMVRMMRAGSGSSFRLHTADGRASGFSTPTVKASARMMKVSRPTTRPLLYRHSPAAGMPGLRTTSRPCSKRRARSAGTPLSQLKPCPGEWST